jgi:hypothetical protein
MIVRLTAEHVENALRSYLEDPDPGVVAIRIPESETIRLSVSRKGGYNVLTGEDAEKRNRASSATGDRTEAVE